MAQDTRILAFDITKGKPVEHNCKKCSSCGSFLFPENASPNAVLKGGRCHSCDTKYAKQLRKNKHIPLIPSGKKIILIDAELYMKFGIRVCGYTDDEPEQIIEQMMQKYLKESENKA